MRKAAVRRVGIRLAAVLMALFLMGGCQSRSDEVESPPAKKESSAPSSSDSVPESSELQEEEKAPEAAAMQDIPVDAKELLAGSSEKSSSDDSDVSEAPAPESSSSASSSAASAVVVNPMVVANRMLNEEGMFYLVSSYSGNGGNFQRSADLQPAQMLWAVYRRALLNGEYSEPLKQDYTGYAQMDQHTVEEQVRRWFGPETPKFTPKPHVLGDPSSSELANLDEEQKRYYFLEIDMELDEEAPHIKSAVLEDNGRITVKFDTQDPKNKSYKRSYTVVLSPSRETSGEYYITSLRKSQKY